MASVEAGDGHDSEPAFRFKRRKLQPHKRVRLNEEEASILPSSQPPINAPHSPAGSDRASQSPSADQDQEKSVPNLKEILRARKRPRDRLREAARKVESTKSVALVPADAPKPDQYSTRFIAQTGHIVDQDDQQMMEYVEARTAEKNHRLYGWPVPAHLKHLVATIAPPVDERALPTASRNATARTTSKAGNNAEGTNPNYSNRMAAGMGKLQEIDLGPEATAQNVQRTEEAFRRIERGVTTNEPSAKIRLGKDGKPRRVRNRRNSEDLRRDKMVEAVLSEAKLDYFEEDKPPSPPANGSANTDEAMVERFRLQFLESMEPRIQKKPAIPPGPKGVKEPSKGPKLGGSRSARAAMRLQEEQAAKSRR
ncbi:hypothetical protein K504DRAFT_451923 [Pleomassaria siparia CBS 279.74]|uniref:Hepatocellular carcinoma-associated antigen 59-domain-containing protein n=1 Tax=Pleomassaria siparia CBS 279.74 TaxID=1314801 RepID=A0A6G1JSB7_9PLEO|nr:hypothetical protein K504DRAFT_451923 [Pleomassaria siparia CBS 279.74]